jgi:hypothetical protein
MNTGYINYIINLILNFIKLKKEDYKTYKNINNNIYFKDINIVEIFILKLNDYLIILRLSNIKYYLFIRFFNFISIS